MIPKPVLTAIFTITPPLFAAITGLVFFKNVRKQYIFLFAFVVFATFTEIALNLYVKFVAKETRPSLHFYILIEFFLLSFFYLRFLNPLVRKNIFLVVVILFEAACIVNVAFIQGLFVYPNFVRAFESLILLVFGLIFFYKVMIEANLKKLSAEPMIWFNTAIIIYFSTNFFFNILYNSILEMSREFLRQIANLYLLNNLFLYSLIAIGFMKSKANPEIKSASKLI